MDNYTVSRVFDLRSVNKPVSGEKILTHDFEYFLMQSRIEGEFGPVVIYFGAQIDSREMHLEVDVISDGGENLDRLFDFRYQETLFFICLLNLFKPSSHEKLPFPSSPEPSNP